MTVHKRYNPNMRFYIAIGVIALLIGVLLFVLLYNGTEEITERGVMSFNAESSAVIIRDEVTYVTPEYTRIEYGAEEGGSVSVGDRLASTYRLGYNDELMVSLLETREQVYREQLKLIGSAKDERLEQIEAEIVALQGRVAEAVMCASGEDVSLLQLQLQTALDERREYLTKVQAKEALTSLYSKEENQLDIVSKWVDTIEAQNSGRISYYFDGYEQAINAEKLSIITADLLKNALKGSASSTWTTDDGTRVCRVVDPDHWYVAFLTDKTSLTRVAEGIEYTVEVEGYGSFTGTALEPVISGDRVINVIEINSDMGGIIDVRVANIKVTAAITGIKVRADAIKNENGNYYLELVLSESHYRLHVDVLAVEGDRVIVRPHDKNDSLGEGVRYWKA